MLRYTGPSLCSNTWDNPHNILRGSSALRNNARQHSFRGILRYGFLHRQRNASRLWNRFDILYRYNSSCWLLMHGD